MRKTMEIEWKVGLFVTIGVGLVMLAILILGGNNSIFTRQISYTAHFTQVEGLVPGAKVVLAGINVGIVDTVDFDPNSKDIVVVLKLNRKYAPWVRKDTIAEIATQGVLGDKYVDLTAGSLDQPELAEGSDIPGRTAKNIAQVLSKSDQLIASLTSISQNLDTIIRSFSSGGRSDTFFSGLATTSKNLASMSGHLNEVVSGKELKHATKNLNSILEKIDNGTGTLGALVNDPGLYDDVKSLVGGANRSRLVRNLVRKTIRDSEDTDAKAAPEAQKK